MDPDDELGLDADLDLDSDDQDEAPTPLPMVMPWELLNSNEFDTALSELSIGSDGWSGCITTGQMSYRPAGTCTATSGKSWDTCIPAG